MQVSSKVTINTAAINHLCDLAKETLVQTAQALHTEVVQAEVMPRGLGTLQGEGGTFIDNSKISQGIVSMVSSTPYARRLYFHPEYNFHRGEWFDAHGEKHGGNAAVRGKWLEPWISGDKKDFCPKTFKKIYMRLLRGAER